MLIPPYALEAIVVHNCADRDYFLAAHLEEVSKAHGSMVVYILENFELLTDVFCER